MIQDTRFTKKIDSMSRIMYLVSYILHYVSWMVHRINFNGKS